MGIRDRTGRLELAAWLPAFLAAALILALFFYWFAIADRYVIFLYNHDMGRDTSPFSRVTASRYWMAGLVADGAVLVLYTAVSWLLGRRIRPYRPPAWWRVWAWAAPLLLPGLLLITMTANEPVLPFAHAARVTLATLIGLALALLPGRLAAEQPAQIIWLALSGLGLMFISTAASNLENVPAWLAQGETRFVWALGLSFGVGLIWTLFVTTSYSWRRGASLSWSALLVAGLCITYLMLPLAHHLLFTDGYFYISDSDNFFAESFLSQLVAWLIIAALAWGIVHLAAGVMGQVVE